MRRPPAHTSTVLAWNSSPSLVRPRTRTSHCTRRCRRRSRASARLSDGFAALWAKCIASSSAERGNLSSSRPRLTGEWFTSPCQRAFRADFAREVGPLAGQFRGGCRWDRAAPDCGWPVQDAGATGSRAGRVPGSPRAHQPYRRTLVGGRREDRHGLEPAKRPAAEGLFRGHGLAEAEEACRSTSTGEQGSEGEFEIDAAASQRLAAGADQNRATIEGGGRKSG